jgi:hypothetical protein
MVVAGMIQLHTLYPAVKRRKNDMTGQAPLRRPPCFMTGSLTFAVVLAACVLMTAATAQSSPKAISGATLRIHVISRSNRRAAERWMSSCSNFRSRCESGYSRAAAGIEFIGLTPVQKQEFRKIKIKQGPVIE